MTKDIKFVGVNEKGIHCTGTLMGINAYMSGTNTSHADISVKYMPNSGVSCNFRYDIPDNSVELAKQLFSMCNKMHYDQKYETFDTVYIDKKKDLVGMAKQRPIAGNISRDFIKEYDILKSFDVYGVDGYYIGKNLTHDKYAIIHVWCDKPATWFENTCYAISFIHNFWKYGYTTEFMFFNLNGTILSTRVVMNPQICDVIMDMGKDGEQISDIWVKLIRLYYDSAIDIVPIYDKGTFIELE